VFNLAPQRHADAATANKFDYSRANWEASKNILINSSENECTVDELNEKLTTEILSAADQSIPVFTYVKKSSNLPPYIQAMIKKRKEIRARIRNTNQSADKTECNKIKKEIDIEIGKKIDLNWSKFMKKCGRSPLSAKPFWKRINDFRSNQTNKSIPTLTDIEKVSVFSEMLKQIFNDNDTASFDENFKRKTERENAKFNYSNTNQQYNKILPIDIVIAIKELPLGSSPGPDGISNEMLKNLPVNIIKQITNLANKSLRECHLPKIWKTAQMTMIHKKATSLIRTITAQ